MEGLNKNCIFCNRWEGDRLAPKIVFDEILGNFGYENLLLGKCPDGDFWYGKTSLCKIAPIGDNEIDTDKFMSGTDGPYKLTPGQYEAIRKKYVDIAIEARYDRVPSDSFDKIDFYSKVLTDYVPYLLGVVSDYLDLVEPDNPIHKQNKGGA